MKVSAFTFIKNGQILGYPFLQSIQSILTIVDEFIINIGESEDDTLMMIQSLASPKIRIIESHWNDSMQDRGYVYGQQKMIAQFNCTGDWAFYIEGDEVYHENELEQIKKSMEMHLNDSNVEALVFDFYHFYGNSNSYLDSPGWYRSEARIIKNSLRTYAPDGLFWLVLDSNKKGRYPRAKHTGASCYHYGWARSEDQMNLKVSKVQKYWDTKPVKIDYSQMDKSIISFSYARKGSTTAEPTLINVADRLLTGTESGAEEEGILGLPGFELIIGILSLTLVSCYKREL